MKNSGNRKMILIERSSAEPVKLISDPESACKRRLKSATRGG
jgi:hypothetical protein